MQMVLAEAKQSLINEQSDLNHANDYPIVIVGTGPVGIRVAQELLKSNPNSIIVQYGAEPWMPYDRVRLSSLLAGEVDTFDIENLLVLNQDSKVTQIHNCKIVSIDRDNFCIVDSRGCRQPYSKLILAVGSSPHVPSIPGVTNRNIFTFRDLSDAEKLSARRIRSRRTVVVGGGLLGLEAAKAMQKNNTEVYIIEHNSWLMQRQLDEPASDLLREHLLSLGIHVYLKTAIKSFEAVGNNQQITLLNGKIITCDTIIIATGIKPNIDLALQAGLHVGKGIKVNDCMQTSDPNIYAVGECIEHDGNVYGLVAPGFEQASIAAHHIAGDSVTYRGSTAATRLKVIGTNVFSMGIVGEDINPTIHKQQFFQDHAKGIYRAITLKHFTVVGAVAIGDWPDITRLQEMITHARNVYPWQTLRFVKTGLLWPTALSDDVATWPARTVVCNCTGVTRGVLSDCIARGINTVDTVMQATGASGVCGSCRPLLVKLVDNSSVVTGNTEVIKGQTAITIISIVGFFFVLLQLFVPAINAPQSVQHFSLNFLWENNVWKQVSGFTLLGITVIGLLVSIRKRWRKLRFGHYNYWRVMHVVLGVILLATLALHTGFHFGTHINFLLMLTYISIAISGVISAAVVAFETKLPLFVAKRARSIVNFTHILLFWPFPTLVGFHIVSFYYF